MSKVEAQRAMRDARYAAYHAKLAADAKAAAAGGAASARPAAAKTPAAQAPAAAEAEAAAPGEQAEVAQLESDAAAPGGSDQPELCGHRNIGNKACSRPAGHTEKNHRYR